MRRLFILAVFIFSGVGSFAQQSKGEVQPVDYTLMGAGMPFFRMKTLDTALSTAATGKGTAKKKKTDDYGETIVKGILTAKDISNTGNLFIMMFSPTCEHCEAQAELFEKNIGLFKDSKLVLMTNPKFATYLPNFMKKLHTLDFPQMPVGLDDSDFIKETFLYQSLPQINIYSSGRKLLKTFTGNVPIDSLKGFIN